MEAILRVIIALILVIGVMWGLAKLAKRPMRGRAASGMDVVARTQLSRGASVAVVKVDGTALVLGVTDHGITLLHQADAGVFDTEAPTKRTAVNLDKVKLGSDKLGSDKLDKFKLDKFKLGPVRARRPAGPAAKGPALAGSALSVKTWRTAIDTIRERSVRGA
ncbi:MAG: flagellar biosynthetic protein FliO [Labedaea sp.]